MKIKTKSDSVNETNLTTQAQTVKKTGNTKFEEGLKQMSKNSDVQNQEKSTQPKATTMVLPEKEDAELSLKNSADIDLKNSNYICVAQNLNINKKDETKNIVDENPQMIADEIIPSASSLSDKKFCADIEEFLPINDKKNETLPLNQLQKSEKPQIQELQETIKTLSNLPVTEKTEVQKPLAKAEKVEVPTISAKPQDNLEKFEATKLQNNLNETTVLNKSPMTEKTEVLKPAIKAENIEISTISAKPQDNLEKFETPKVQNKLEETPVLNKSPMIEKTEVQKPAIKAEKQDEPTVLSKSPMIEKTEVQIPTAKIENVKVENTLLQENKIQPLKADEILPQLNVEVKPQVQATIAEFQPISKIKTETVDTKKTTVPKAKDIEKTIIPDAVAETVIQPVQTNDLLAQILNENVDLTQKVPTMEEIIPFQLRPANKKDALSSDEKIDLTKKSTDDTKPMTNLKTFLSEVLSPETVEDIKVKDVAIQDDNNLLNDEIRNYYNLNNAKAAAAMDDIKTMLNERVTVLEDISKVIASNSEAKEISKELKSIESKKEPETKSLKVTEKDATFFANLVKENQVTEQVVNDTTKTMQEDIKQATETAKTTTVSKALADMISEASKTNKPFRIDFDKDVSVIIKVDKDGKISADFIPGDKAVEQYLRNSMPLLRQKFADEQIDYKELNYRQSNKQNKERKNKENKNE